MDIGNVIAAVVVLAVLGAVFGFILAVASKVFEVKKDPREEEILSHLVRPCRRGECCRHRKDHGPGGSLR